MRCHARALLCERRASRAGCVANEVDYVIVRCVVHDRLLHECSFMLVVRRGASRLVNVKA